MKIFSDDPKPTPKPKMRADRFGRIFVNALISGLAAFFLSLAIPDVELGRVAFALMFVVFMVGADLRDRCTELFRLLKERG
jgi:hypothetical protein